jgi:twitching motility protein PilT
MDTDKEKYINMRSAKRAKAKFTVRYCVGPRKEALPLVVSTVDISSKSLTFESADSLSIGTRISGDLIAPFLPGPIKFSGNIKRIEEIAKGEKYLYAVVFDEIGKEDQLDLENYVQSIDIHSILRLAIKNNASDIHFVANKPYFFRIHGELAPSGPFPISSEDLKEMIHGMLSPHGREEFEKNLELDFSFTLPEGNHFRVNVHLEKGHLEAALRVIPMEIKTIQELRLPPVVGELTKKKKGLILVTGPAGSGKTTTQAAMIDTINKESARLIISIEDPIEYVHECKKGIVKQRAVGSDTLSFASAIKHSLRQDPNVIFIGEMRDLESISMALTAAETGHLVLSTLHTIGAAESMHRLADVYPPEQQFQIFSLLASCLEGVISQILLPTKDGKGRVLATEILIATPAVKNLIRTGKLEQLSTYLDTGSDVGMHSLDSSIVKLFKDGLISEETALSFARNQERMRVLLKR